MMDYYERTHEVIIEEFNIGFERDTFNSASETMWNKTNRWIHSDKLRRNTKYKFTIDATNLNNILPAHKPKHADTDTYETP